MQRQMARPEDFDEMLRELEGDDPVPQRFFLSLAVGGAGQSQRSPGAARRPASVIGDDDINTGGTGGSDGLTGGIMPQSASDDEASPKPRCASAGRPDRSRRRARMRWGTKDARRSGAAQNAVSMATTGLPS